MREAGSKNLSSRDNQTYKSYCLSLPADHRCRVAEVNHKPGFVLHENEVVTINLGLLLPTGSSNQPESIGRAALKHFPI